MEYFQRTMELMEKMMMIFINSRLRAISLNRAYLVRASLGTSNILKPLSEIARRPSKMKNYEGKKNGKGRRK